MTVLRFANPWGGLAFLAVLLFLLWRLLRSGSRQASLLFSGTEPLRAIRPGLAVRLRNLPKALRVAGLALLVVAFARP